MSTRSNRSPRFASARHFPLTRVVLGATGVALAVIALSAVPLRAQDAKPDTAKPVTVTAGLSFLDASGNTDITSLSVNERLEWKRPRFLWAQFVNAVNGTTDGEESANLIAAGLRGDWKPHGRLSVYGLVNYDRNRFANIGRRFEEGAGLGYAMIERSMHRLAVELGGQFVQQRNLEEVSDNFLAGRAAQVYRYTFRTTSYIEERVEYLPNLEESSDYRMNGEANVVAPLSRHLSLKIGYVVRFDNLPEPGVEKTDRFLTSGLQIAF